MISRKIIFYLFLVFGWPKGEVKRLRDESKSPFGGTSVSFFYPDDVVSAQHILQFAEGLVKRGWKVTVLTSNRYCRYPEKKILRRSELWQSIHIIRISRPGWAQANRCFRLANSAWMIIGWGLKLGRIPRAEAIIIGSDPPFSALLFPVLRLLKRGKLLVHWCYDLYPEVIMADGAKGFVSWALKGLTPLMGWAYRSVDLMVDIGACMRKRLNAYHHNAHCATLIPWALVEPDYMQKPDEVIRSELFKGARLALLYSGNLGKAHDFSPFLQLARRLRRENSKIAFCFACRGNRAEELKKAVRADDHNISFAPFVKESELERKLTCADIHLLSLRPEWEGIVVPSKFFGSLAVGRPILYAGPEGSAIADWIREYNIGLILTKDNMEEVAKKLLQIANEPGPLGIWQENAFQAYKHFSRTTVINRWDELLRHLLLEPIPKHLMQLASEEEH